VVKYLPKDEAERLVRASVERLERTAEAAELGEIERDLNRAIASATNIETVKQMLRGMLAAGQEASELKKQLEEAFRDSKPGAR
jgi:hypothetical protein